MCTVAFSCNSKKTLECKAVEAVHADCTINFAINRSSLTLEDSSVEFESSIKNQDCKVELPKVYPPDGQRREDFKHIGQNWKRHNLPPPPTNHVVHT